VIEFFHEALRVEGLHSPGERAAVTNWDGDSR
jgi:hypothetical protein